MSSVAEEPKATTPKAKTMELFGRPPNPNAPAGPDNLPAPFHVYSMRQAIEEGFILDVQKNYTPYSLAFKLANDGKEFTDTEVEQSTALKSLMQWVKLHPWNISQKVAIVVEHYRSMVMPLLEGKPVSHAGEAFNVNGGVNVPGGTRPNVVIAALGEQMLKVTAALADGTLTWCTGPQTLANHTIPTLKAAADTAGRDSTRVIAALPVCVTNDREAALQRAAQVFVVYGQLPSYRAMLDKEGAAGPADIAIIGNASEVADRIMALAEIGVTDFAAVEFGATPDEVAETRAMVKSLLK